MASRWARRATATRASRWQTKLDKKGRLRADGFKLVVIPEDARIVQRIFAHFVEGKAITKIACELNDEGGADETRLKGGWNVSTISRILKDENYTDKRIRSRASGRRSSARRRSGSALNLRTVADGGDGSNRLHWWS